MAVVRRVPATAVLAVWIVVIWLIDPALEGLSYYVLAPWAHDGWSHLDQNLVILVIFGGLVERWVEWWEFSAVSIGTAYLSLFGPVTLGFGGWSQGASGTTNVYIGFVGIVVASRFLRRFADAVSLRDWAVVMIYFLGVVIFIGKLMVTGARFIGAAAPPEGTAVGAHALGLVFGMLWFATKRHILDSLWRACHRIIPNGLFHLTEQ
jgi:membrane associated rhomboid family serine protease